MRRDKKNMKKAKKEPKVNLAISRKELDVGPLPQPKK